MNTTKHFIIFFILILALSVSGGAVAGEISFTLPSGWSEQPLPNVSYKHFVFTNAQNNILAELFIFKEALSQIITNEGYMQALQKNGLPSYKNYTPKENASETISGVTLPRHDFLFMPANQTIQFKGRVYALIADKEAFTFFFDCAEKNFDTLIPQFSALMQGSKFPVTGTSQPPPTVTTHPSPENTVVPLVEGTPYPTIPAATLPLLPSSPAQTGNLYTDPLGVFSLTLPQGCTLSDNFTRDGTAQAIYQTPNQGELIVASFSDPQELQNDAIPEATRGKQFHGATSLMVGGKKATISLYSQTPQNNQQIVTIITTFEGTNAGLLLILPASEYQSAQSWILGLVKGMNWIK